MLLVIYLLLLFSQSWFVAQAAPAAVDPVSLSLNNILAANLSTTPSLLFDEE